MTPAEHKTAAEALFAWIAHPTKTEPDDAAHALAEAHAHLATAAGTGDHYTAADTLLATADATVNYMGITRAKLAREAKLHAILADR